MASAAISRHTLSDNDMNKIAIAFAFDSRLLMPASVCISSLLMSADNDTFYDIYIIHSADESFKGSLLDSIPVHYSHCSISYRAVDSRFASAYQVRGITVATYYRLMLPELVPEYDKIIYSDVDIIFRTDLGKVYNVDLGSNLIAAALDLGMNLGKDGLKHISSVHGLCPGQYLQAGLLLLNLKQMREEDMVNKFMSLADRRFRFQDQDILNMACAGRISWLEPKYNMTDYSFYYGMRHRDEVSGLMDLRQIDEGMKSGNLHFNGHKPWKGYSVNFDIWWEYYRKSPFFDPEFYFEFFYRRLEEYDRLPLWKRIKILARYFVFGRKKD